MQIEDLVEHKEVQEAIAAELAVDMGSGDATTLALVPEERIVRASILTREACRVSGTMVAAHALHLLDPDMHITIVQPDGSDAAPGGVLLELQGQARAIVTAERTALNFMQRMCGIATQTRRFVAAVAPLPVAILDTRKTTPGMRVFEKYAVACGGGVNHRLGLYDKIMIKDNHRWLRGGEGGLEDAVRAAREAYPALAVEVEVETLAQLEAALQGGAHEILLDNMSPDLLRTCVERCRGRVRTEASGGITLDTIRAVAETGVDAISLGCLTHTIRSVDLSLEMERD